MIAAAVSLWRTRWGFVRLAIAAFLLWALASDSGARLARLQLAALPGFDFVGETAKLRGEGRFSEAILVAEQGLAEPGLKSAAHTALARERDLALTQRDAWTRRGADVLRGIALGADADSSLERLIGAVTADFFIVGDIRDLTIQAARSIRGEETDKVIIALSTLGLATTLAPEIDWAPSILKAARRAGCLSERLGEFIVHAVKTRDVRSLTRLTGETASLARVASPGVAARLLLLADSPAELTRLAGYVGREGRAGAFALRTTGRAGADVLRSADELRTMGRAAEAARAESAVLAAAKKGTAGSAWLRRGAWRPLTRPHALVGLGKAIWSGRAAALVQHALERLDPHAWWAIPILAAWTIFEAGLILLRLSPGTQTPSTRPRPAAA